MWHLDEGTIHAWLDGALSADEARRVEAHVGSCTGCADAVAEARGLIAASSRILTALDDVPYVRGAGSAGGAKGQRRSLTTWLVRERIAAVVAMVVATGALALVVGRDDRPAPASVEALSEPVATVELAAADSPTAPPAPSQAKEGEGARAVRVATPVAAPPTARDLAMNRRADSAPASTAFLAEEVAVAEADRSRSQARTDDTLRPIALAQAPRAQAQASSAEGKAAVAANLPTVVPSRQRGAEASARFAPPPSEQAMGVRGAAVGSARDTRLVLEERMTESGRDVRRLIYRVDNILVTLDERAPDTTTKAEERVRRVELNALAAAPKDSAASVTNTIRWTDARGAEFTLSGPVSPARLEEIRKLLGY